MSRLLIDEDESKSIAPTFPAHISEFIESHIGIYMFIINMLKIHLILRTSKPQGPGSGLVAS